ncbi:MAG: LysM peptidoglycan-binding domain-containing protein [Ilumatobacteraceae bacterium]
MKSTSRAGFALTIGAAAMALLSGCGSSDGEAAGSGDTLNYVPTTSYALKAPATTTTTTTLAPGETPAGGTVPTEQSYTIKANDNLFKIASLYDVEIELICSYNQWTDCINPPHLLLPGDTILIPPGSAVAGSTQTASTDTGSTDTGSTDSGSTDSGDTETATGTGCSHTIVSGDNPTRVASKYGITVDQLSNANLNNPVWNTFLIGSTLNIPPEGNC